MKLTRHAADRADERINWSHDVTQKMAEKALRFGLIHSDVSGSFNRYITKLYMAHGKANNVRVYGEHVYLFCGETLLTILPLPKKYKDASRRVLEAMKAVSLEV